jgi:hypothetical protein
MSNESSALVLAKEIEYRFMFRFLTTRYRFDDVRLATNNKQLTDLECFLKYIEVQLSSTAKGILELAQERYDKYTALVETVLKKTKESSKKLPLEQEADQIKAILDFEVKQNKKDTNWSFHAGGVNRLVDDFLLFREYQTITQNEGFRTWCSRLGMFLVTDKEAEEINQIADDLERANKWTEKTSPMLLPIWSFFLALCYTLQRGENDFLTAHDAYWLGLIDEVIGDQDLKPIRLLRENEDEPEPKKTSTKEKAKPKKSKTTK